jgi:hexosaminidase
VIVWISSDDAKSIAEAGYNIVHAPVTNFYLDVGMGGWIGDNQGGSWSPFVSWQNAYAFDPYANITKADEHLVKGGQTMLWAEQISPGSLDDTVWPRAAAAAELWWKGGEAGSYPLETKTVLPRMHDIQYRMVGRGINARVLQPL